MSEPAEIHAVLIALARDSLLLPNVAVVETVPLEDLQVAVDAPAWLAGHVQREAQRLPVLRLERLNGDMGEPDLRRARVIVVKLPDPVDGLTAIGVLAQAYPHLVTLNRAAMRAEALRDSDRSDLVLARVRLGNQVCWIPDFGIVMAEIRTLSRAA